MKKEERMGWMIVGESTEGEKRTTREIERGTGGVARRHHPSHCSQKRIFLNPFAYFSNHVAEQAKKTFGAVAGVRRRISQELRPESQ